MQVSSRYGVYEHFSRSQRSIRESARQPRTAHARTIAPFSSMRKALIRETHAIASPSYLSLNAERRPTGMGAPSLHHARDDRDARMEDDRDRTTDFSPGTARRIPDRTGRHSERPRMASRSELPVPFSPPAARLPFRRRQPRSP